MRSAESANTDVKRQAAPKMLYGQRRLPNVSRSVLDELDAREQEKSQSEQTARQDN